MNYLGLTMSWCMLAVVLCAPILVSRRRPAFFVPFFTCLVLTVVGAWLGPRPELPLVLPAVVFGSAAGGASLLLFIVARKIKSHLAYRGIIDWIDPYELDMEGDESQLHGEATSKSAPEGASSEASHA